MRPEDVEGWRVVVCGLWFVVCGSWFGAGGLCILGLKPDIDMQVMVTSKRLTGSILSHSGFLQMLEAQGKNNLTRPPMNTSTSSREATGWYL